MDAIWDGIPFETPVIPAKSLPEACRRAGIQSGDSSFAKVCGVDFRRLTGMTATSSARVSPMA
jgi:hypothetical protein